MRKVALIGLDCAAPAVFFERYRSEIPNLDRWLREAAFGEMRSCDPPITVPAWASLFSGSDAGELGIYGFRNRVAHDYSGYRIATSRSVRRKCVWDVVAETGGRSILLGVPPSYPPPGIRGDAVGCFLTPSGAARTTSPADLAEEIARIAPDYAFDVDGFRTAERGDLLDRLTTMTEARFRVACHLVRTRPWDFFAMVEIGIDRLNHAFWRFMDPAHPDYRPGTAMEAKVVAYLRRLDACLGDLFDCLGGDTVVMLASDHGAQPMLGGVCVNEWLRREGFLRMHREPTGVEPLRSEDVDWSSTTAWSDGGYYARVFLNVRDREPSGRVGAEEGDCVLDESAAGLAEIEDEDGHRIGAALHRPAELFRASEGVPPDGIVYFGDLAWRSVGTVGHCAVTTPVNDTGADDANHDWNGIFAMRDSRAAWRGTRMHGLRLLDVAATILDRAGYDPVLPGTPFGCGNEIKNVHEVPAA